MKIAVIYGTERKGSTYNIAQLFISKLSDAKEDVTEFFLPTSMPNFCRGCFMCFNESSNCPDYKYAKPVLDAMLNADILIFASPVYVYHVTGQMKTFLDHFAFQWMVHKPNEKMFKKQALIISTAAGGGTKSTMKDIKDSMNYWGVAKTHTYGVNVAAGSWNHVSDKKKTEIKNAVDKLSTKIKNNSSHVKPCLKVKTLFYGMRFFHKKFGVNKPDVEYWENKGWLYKTRPW